ncbi:MAG: EF-hand domain-containing protein [Planctomycetota bacterium]
MASLGRNRARLFFCADYDEVVGWAEMIVEVIDQERMPPWHADPSIGKFIGARGVPKTQRDKIARWIANGMPKGNVADSPPKPKFSSGWHLETNPDLEIAMRERPFIVPADGIVEYQYFVVDPKWTKDRWVRAAQVIPGDASVVHHAIVFVRPPDGQASFGIGWLGAYVPGQRTIPLPLDHARRIPAGSKLVFQMHYTPTGVSTSDRTRLGVWFSDADSIKNQVTTHIALNHEFEIPPGDDAFEVRLSSKSFPRHGKLLGITPHMHFRGKSFRLFASKLGDVATDDVSGGQSRGERTEEWLRVPRYDFNWQHWYAFQVPRDLNDVESLEMRVEFDNSWTNPFNPDASEYVSWGDQTWEEMAVAFFDVATPRDKPLHRIRSIANPSKAVLSKMRARGEERADKFFEEMDLNRDGIVERDETPDTFRRFGFHRMDHNHDRRITRDEVLEEASTRD